MPDDDLAQRAARHEPIRYTDPEREAVSWDRCGMCIQPWPCDASLFAAALVAQEGQADPQADLSTAAIQQRAPFAYGQWRVDLATLLERLTTAEAALAAEQKEVSRLAFLHQHDHALADRWYADKERLEQQLAAEQAARARIATAARALMATIRFHPDHSMTTFRSEWGELEAALAGEEER
jgi:hypothetical protein